MSERSIESWRLRFRERRAFQQTEVGLRDGGRAMGKALSQILDGEQDPVGTRGRAGRFGAEGELKMSRWRCSQRRHFAGGRAEGRRRPCGASRAAEAGRIRAGS
jgi:hypothetical protein